MKIHFILYTFYGFLIKYRYTSRLINFPFNDAGFYDPPKLYPV